MTTPDPTDDALCNLLSSMRDIAVVGLSPKENRPSNEVARYLMARGYRIYPVNPAYAGGEILGRPVHESLAALAESGVRVDVADIFRRSEEAGVSVDEALAAFPGLRAVWLQIGVIDAAACARAESRGVMAVMDRCPKIEHARLAAAGCPGLAG